MVCYILTNRMRNFATPKLPPSPIDRQSELLLKIKEQGTALIGDLAEQFQVSEMTIRRMIHRLADAGLVIRTPGGAMAAPAGSMERTFLERSAKMAGAKEALGRAAAGLVAEGETVVLDSGTTTQCIARYMATHHDVVTITSSLAVLDELAGSPGVQVRLTGGAYRRSSHDLAGNSVVEALEGVYADKVFFGAAALSFQKGVMNYDAQMPRAYLNAGKQKILVIDSSKIGHEAVYRLCPVESCDLVITDAAINASDLAKLKKLTKVLVAE